MSPDPSGTGINPLSAEFNKYWVVEPDRGRIRIILQDGRELEGPIMRSRERLPSEIAMAVFDWESWWVFNVTKRGGTVISEVYSPNAVDPRRGRRTVYLDQNHWRSVAQTKVDITRIRNKAEASAAERVVKLATDLGVILPLSSAHMRETAPLYGDLRYNVGVAMASLSSGWQLRHPTAVWLMEIVELVGRVMGLAVPAYAARDVVSLEPGALTQQSHEIAMPRPSDIQLLIDAIGASSVVLEMLIDPESVKAIDLPQWVAENQRITDLLSEVEEGPRRKRSMAYQEFWRANFETVRQAGALLGVSVEELYKLDGEAIEGYLDDLPMLAHVGGLHVTRYVDKSTRWKRNDLTDIMFLGCAAGYCDYVVAERHTGSQLRSIQRARGVQTSVFSNLEELVGELNTSGVKTASERLESETSS